MTCARCNGHGTVGNRGTGTVSECGECGGSGEAEQILAADEVCACLDETGERQVRMFERCERCHALMEQSESADEWREQWERAEQRAEQAGRERDEAREDLRLLSCSDDEYGLAMMASSSMGRDREQNRKHESCVGYRLRAEALEARVAELEGALVELDDVHSRLIAAVTPGHIGWIKGPSEEYTGLFSEWHRATRKCRSLVGPAPDPKERT